MESTSSKMAAHFSGRPLAFNKKLDLIAQDIQGLLMEAIGNSKGSRRVEVIGDPPTALTIYDPN